MTELDPERGREVAEQLKALGFRGILVTAANKGYVTSLSCAMPTCRCPKEVGGKSHFDPVPEELPDWMPTADHMELKSEGGKLTVENVRLAHRLCNRIHYAETHNKAHEKDLERIEAARQRAGLRQGKTRLTIEVSEESLRWAVLHINNYIADQPVNTEPLAHEFVSALTNPSR